MSRPIQDEIPGTEAPKIKQIENAAAKYVDARDSRMKLTEKECAAKTNLIAVCQEHAEKMNVNADGDRVYRYDDLLVVLTDKLNVKVRSAQEPVEEE